MRSRESLLFDTDNLLLRHDAVGFDLVSGKVAAGLRRGRQIEPVKLALNLADCLLD